MLVISGHRITPARENRHVDIFNLAIEMLFISGFVPHRDPVTPEIVSISQSRCLSFQAGSFQAVSFGAAGFNLAIEMLVISGKRPSASSHA